MGAPSGAYQVQLTSATQGRIDGSALNLITIIEVTGMTPSQGSTLGGTLVTFTGGQFSDDALDNPVKVGDHYCLVEETSQTEIKCRIAVEGGQAPGDAQALVFAATSEEAVCSVPAGCVFEFVAPASEVTGLTNSFDASSNEQRLLLTGNNFPVGDTSGVELLIDGV